ncbi:Gfo/Idh/MocA family oxidoreductase [Saliphagus sp. GCM10025308]
MVSGTEGITVEDVATLQLETAGGAIGTLHCGYHLGEGVYDTRIDLYGSDGRSSWDPMGRKFGFEGETTLELDDTSGEWACTPHRRITHEYDPTPGYGGSWGKDFVEEFFEACDGKGDPPVTLEDAVAVLRILDAAYDSAETGEWVDVDTDASAT